MTDGIGDIHKRLNAYLGTQRPFGFPKRLTNEAIIDHALCLTTHADVYDIDIVGSHNGIIPIHPGYGEPGIGDGGRALKEFEKKLNEWGAILKENFPDDVKQPRNYARVLLHALARC